MELDTEMELDAGKFLVVESERKGAEGNIY
jgi:hypothetical protein